MNASIQAVAKRYRYTGKERDEESGLYYHGARYYIPWLCRWTACDPLESKYAGMSPYNYSFNNPLVFNDPSGMGPDDPPQNYNTPPAIDNTRVYKVNPYEETAPAGYLTPDGGRIRLPQGTAIGDTVSETGEYRIDGQNVILSPGGVLSFTLEGNTYNAQFGDDNKFVGYYTDDRSNYVTYEGKSVPFKLNTREAGAFMLAGWTAAGQTALADGPEPGPADVGGAIVGVGTTILSGLFLFDAASGNISMTRPVAIPIDLSPPKPNEDKGTIIYRSMKMDNMGMPIEEESARGLGVRVNGDIPVIEGMVSPFTGGMSVAPDDPKNLPLHRRPANLGGTGKDPVFVMNTKDLPYGLMYDPDKPDHGTIQPAFPMPYEAYKALLSTTKLLWKPYGK